MEDNEDKFYPGENKDSLTDFKEAPGSSSSPPKRKKTKASNSDVSQTFYTPLHFIGLVVGLLFFIAGYAIFILGHHPPDGWIFEMTNKKRMLLAAFLAFLASWALLFGFKNKRRIGIIMTAFLGGGLCYLPIHYRDAYRTERDRIHYMRSQASKPTVGTNIKQPSNPDIFPPNQPNESNNHPKTPLNDEEYFKKNLNYEEFLTLKANDPNAKTIGLLMENLPHSHIEDMQELFETTLRSLKGGEKTKVKVVKTLYPIHTMQSAILMVQHHFKDNKPVELLYKHLSNQVGQTELPGIKFLKVNDNIIITNFVVRQKDTLKNLNQVNLLLLNINQNIQKKALDRLNQTQVIILAHDVLSSLSIMLKTRDQKFKASVTKSIQHWIKLIANEDEVAERMAKYIEAVKKQVLEEARRQISLNQKIDPVYLRFISDFAIKDCQDIAFHVWAASPIRNEDLLLSMDRTAAKAIGPNLEKLNEIQLLSACTILSKVGTPDEIPTLEKLVAASVDKKIQLSLTSTIDAIKKRH